MGKEMEEWGEYITWPWSQLVKSKMSMASHIRGHAMNSYRMKCHVVV